MKIIRILICVLMIAMNTHIEAQELKIIVYGACGMCEERIESAAKEVIGVQSADWNNDNFVLTITHDDFLFRESELHSKMISIGHDTDKMTASDEVYNGLHSCCKYREIIEYPVESNEVIITVYGTCGMCKERIESAAMEVIGVASAEWNSENFALRITHDGFLFQENDLHKKMISIGHDTHLMKTEDEIYDDLHACCKYRDLIDYSKANHLNHDHDGDGIPEHDDDFHIGKYSGMVYEMSAEGKLQPLIGANVYLSGTGIGTSTDKEGYFIFKKPEEQENELIVISYTGYQNDTIDMTGNSIVSVTLKSSFVMDEVEIVHKKKTTEISFINPIKVQNITEKELCKAACCNLSESFETNPSVDGSATDAVTGTRKIEMLGLAGPYVQVTRENMPYIRGLAAIYGFSYTPGTWIESIQLNMGSGSVVNGPESMTGQINVELRKPELSEKFYLNLYANAAGRLEGNITSAHKVNDKWDTGLLLHGNYQSGVQDRNNDNFQDMPNNNDVIILNRWKYNSGNGLGAHFGVKGTYVNNTSGQINAMADGPQSGQRWRADIETSRLEGWMKVGKVMEDRPYASIGFQASASYHDQNALFGLRNYDATQSSLYANLIYQTIIKDTRHTIKFGASYQFDDFDEFVVENTYQRQEHMPGAFTEYQFTPNEKWTAVLGLRADRHNLYGTFLTPRMHLKYNPVETTSFRFAAGRGQRTPTIFAENIGLFASNRSIIIEDNINGLPYGLTQETAWNIGANFTKEFKIGEKSTVIGLDYYYTTFENQVVVDYDIHPQEIHFYNLDGRSFSHSIQAQMDMEIVEGFDFRVAYRYNDPRTDFREGERQRPLISKQRAFANIGIELGKGWIYDLTANWQGSKRIPFTDQNPEEFQLEESSPSFMVFNSQVSKTFAKKNLDIYLGGENILDYRQERNILSFDNPFGSYFDSSLVWGPVQGRVVYLGMRYKIL